MGVDMRDVELFANDMLSKGGTWFELEKCGAYVLYKTQSIFCDGRNWHGFKPVYQVFDGDGKRVFASTNYNNAMRILRKGKNDNV